MAILEQFLKNSGVKNYKNTEITSDIFPFVLRLSVAGYLWLLDLINAEEE